MASNGAAEAEALAGGSAEGATLADGVVPVQATTIAAVPSNAANRRGKLEERVMRRFSS